MNTPVPLARVQQITGVPEHPCEFILRGGAWIYPYEEMEVRFFPEHSGVYLATLLGEPFELFAGKGRTAVTLEEGYLPIITHSADQQGVHVEQTSFACLLGAESVTDGTEPLIGMMRLRISNPGDSRLRLPVSLVFGSCFRPQEQEDDYWKNFLLRDDLPAELSTEEELPPYPYPLRQEGGMLLAEEKGIVLSTEDGGAFYAEYGDGTWAEGRHFRNGWRIPLELAPGETKTLTFRLPYLPLSPEKAAELAAMDFDTERQKIAAMWKTCFAAGASLTVPGTRLGELWKAQTAYTLMLIDRQNKGGSALYGREMYRSWAESYPDKVLSYPHLSPTLYEFIWAQESGYWVLGTLDLQGYHELTERCFEVFFALQGVGVPGVHDPSILPEPQLAQSFMGTTPHAWLNSNGGVLSAIARHYRLTRNKAWIMAHHDAIVRACRWSQLLRASTKQEPDPACRGIMPRGQSTDATFASGHLQWYYTDVGTLAGLRDILPVMRECDFPEAEEFRLEYEDYRDCLLRSVDRTMLDVCDFEEDVRRYDFSQCLYENALPQSRIRDFDEYGMPRVFKGKIPTKSEAVRRGIRFFLPMSPQLRIPFAFPYCDNQLQHVFGFLADIIDYSSEKPLFDGAKHSGKDVWTAIVDYGRLMEQFDPDAGIYAAGFPYNDYFLTKLLACDETEEYEKVLAFLQRYGCDDESFVMIEYAGAITKEYWFQPCPFALSMAVFRAALRNALLYEDSRRDTLVIGKATPKTWMENAMSLEKPILLENAATEYGPVTLRIDADPFCRSITVTLQLQEGARLPAAFEVRANHPQKRPVRAVTVGGRAVPCGDTVLVPREGLQGDRLEVTFSF